MSTPWFPRIVVATIVLGPSVASAAKPGDPANVTGLSQAMEVVAEGNDLLVARDAPGAIEAYRRAIKLQPRNPVGHLMLGQALVTTNALAEAEAAFRAGDAVADTTPAIKARLLFSIADLKERQKKLDDAKAAWQRYADYGAKRDKSSAVEGGASGSTFASTASARIAVIDAVLKQEKAYEIVRQRIAEDKK